MFDDLIQSAAVRYVIPESWIRAVIQVESSWNPSAIGPTGDYGLMQVTIPTAAGLGYTGSPEGLLNPETNIDLGSKLLGQLRNAYGDDFRRVYSAYNSGSPDLWQTSDQVAANVSRAVLALESFAGSASGMGLGLVLLAGLLFWFLRK